MNTKRNPPLWPHQIRLIKRALKDKGWSPTDLAKAIEEKTDYRICRETLYRHLNGEFGPPSEVREHIQTALGLRPYSLTHQPPPRVTGTSLSPAKDKKNRLTGDAVRGRLLRMTSPPSFVEVVRNSEVFYAGSVEEKVEKPAHYFQPAAIFRVTWPGQLESYLLTYAREPKKGILKYQLVGGMAILFGASYSIRQSDYPWPMDEWLQTVEEDPAEAPADLTVGRGSVLVQLLDYKLDLSAFDTSFCPFGVVTNDLRESKKAVYTAYVFLGELKFSERPSETELAELSRDGSKLFLKEESDRPDQFCIDSEGRPLCMDVAVWKALQSGELVEALQTASFRKGFDVV